MRLAVLVSGRGSNLGAVLDAVADQRLLDVQAVLVISNRAGVPALAVAAAHDVPSRVLTRAAFASADARDRGHRDGGRRRRRGTCPAGRL